MKNIILLVLVVLTFNFSNAQAPDEFPDGLVVGNNDTGYREGQLRFNLGVLEVYDGTSWRPLGNSIPLSGTEVGSPVTGNLQIDTNLKIYSELENDDYKREIVFGYDVLAINAISPTDGEGIYVNLDIASRRLDLITSTDFLTRFSVAEDYFEFHSTSPNSRGLTSLIYYGNNITANDFTQKDYVDTEIASAISGSSIILPIRLTNATYTFVEADLLASSVYYFDVAGGTDILLTIPDGVTLPTNEAIVITIKTINENNIKVIPETLGTGKVEFTPRIKGEAISFASFTSGSYLKWDNVNAADFELELLTAANAAGLVNEADNELEWSSNWNFEVETSDTNGSSFALKVINGADTNALTYLDGLDVTVGDVITYTFDAKCNTQNAQAVRPNNTDGDTDFWTAGNQPLVWTTYTVTAVATSATINMLVTGSPAGQPVTDYILIDNLSITNKGQ